MSAFKWLTLVLIAGMGMLVLSLIAISDLGNRDYISYWAAGDLLASRVNPYDQAAVLRLEKFVGLTGMRPMIMRNPPLMLPLTLLLAALGARLGAVVWTTGTLLAIAITVHMTRERPDRTHIVGYLFAPGLACLMAGQTAAILLLGFVLFLRFHDRHEPLAGAAAVAFLFKPHLFLPFGIVLGMWIIARQRYRLLFALGATAFFLGIVPLYWYPQVWSGYFEMLRGAGIQDEFVPTISSVLALAFDSKVVQFMPAIVSSIWAAVYFFRRVRNWNWHTNGGLVLAVSLATAPYAWFTDELVLLPLILPLLYNCSDRSARWFAILNGIALLELLAGVGMPSGAYIWTPIAWLSWLAFSGLNSVQPEQSETTAVYSGR